MNSEPVNAYKYKLDSYIQYQVSSIKYQASSIQYPVSSIQHQASSICPPKDAKFRNPNRKHQELIIFLFVYINMFDPGLEKEGAQLYLLLVRGKANQKLLFTGHPFQALYVL